MYKNCQYSKQETNYPIMLCNLSFRYLRITISFLFFLALCLSTHNIHPRTKLSGLLRANRWQEIEKLFKNRNPHYNQESYAAAMAILNTTQPGHSENKKIVEAFHYLLSILDLSCSQTKKKALLDCIEKERIEAKQENMQRTAAWQGIIQAQKHNMPLLALYLARIVSLKPRDPLSEVIFQKRLGLLIRNKKFSSALYLVNRSDLRRFSSPFSNFLRARTLAYAQEKDRSLYFYFQSAHQGAVAWIRKSILRDIRHFYPGVLNIKKPSTSERSFQRKLIALSENLSRQQIRYLKQTFTVQTIIKSTNRQRLLTDGIFLIKSNQANYLTSLSGGFYAYLSKNPSVLMQWASHLRSSKQNYQALKILKPFRDIFSTHSPLWYNYIELLAKEYGKKSRSYFNETLKYLQFYPYKTLVQDILLENLIGSSSKKIKWAPSKDWKQVKDKLPHHSASGRFFYWLKRYYKEHGQLQEFQELQENFYSYAPGSFYVSETWNKKANDRNYKKDWFRVKNNNSYIRWLSKHGGNRKARQFLSNTNIEKYQNPKADKILDLLNDLDEPRDDIARLFFSLGHWQEGTRFFRELYTNKLSRREYLMRLVQLGIWSKTLNVQVYYLRQLLREERINIDPFRVPTALGKLLYPRPYRDIVRKYSRRYGTNEHMNYALMRQESLFRENAVSRSNAQGLMQIMPRTGKWLRRYIPELANKPLYLQDPKTNIHLGVYYFSRLVKKNQGDFRWATIAYNGGPGNLKKWKRRYYHGDFYYFLERLPNNESRNYCRFTHENNLRYDIFYDLSH